MWNNTGGGGFMNTSSTFSPDQNTQGDKKQGKRAQNLVPVCIKSILTCNEDQIKISDIEVNMVTVVALVKQVEHSSTKVTYTIDDGTGFIDAVFWTEGDQNDSDAPVVENTYCRVIGTIRSQQDKKYLMVFKITSLSNLNELTTHILEVIYADLKLKQLSQKQAMGATMINQAPNLSNTMMGMNSTFSSNNGVTDSLNPQQALVYNTIHACRDEQGVYRDGIFSNLRGKLRTDEINNILDYLTGEGHIYTTIDDNHFKATDCMD